MASKLKIIPLGGIAEIGKNLTVVEYGKDIILIDCGSIFPTDEMPGVDLVIPDMEYLEKNASRIRGIIITHGHEDHIGAVPYALKQFTVPVYGSKLSLALINHKLEEHGISGADLRCVQPGDTIKLGCMSIEFIHVNHSIAGAMAVAITTPAGIVIHTGDFKIDYTPVDGAPADLARFAYYGQKGILCLMSDSTNAELPGYTMSESMVGETFERYFDEAEGRVIIATFASNINRIQQIVDTALRHGRKICFQGRSMINISQLASELGYLNIEEKNLVDVEKLKRYRDDQICVITTGSQGEPMSGLARMAGSAHKQLVIGEGDLVIISASAIPGNEKTISNVINQLCAKGAQVVYQAMADVHVSGHARQEEQKLLLSLIKPRYFIPVHGEYRHLMNHVALAKKLGIPEENTFMLSIGEVLEFSRGVAKRNGSVPSGSVMIDGSGVGDIGNIVLRDRKLLSEEGLVVVVVALAKKTGKLLSGPDVITRGFVYVRESEELIDEACQVIRKVVQDFEKKPYSDWAAIKSAMKNTLRDYFYSKTKRNPVILPIIQEI